MGRVRILDEEGVLALLPSLDVAGTLRGLFLALHAGRAVQPPQTLAVFPGGAGDVITYGGVMADEGVFGAKLSPYLLRSPAPMVTAWTLLMSMETGAPLLLCDARRLTMERTAGTSALAVDLLAPEAANALVVVGTGEAAEAHLRHVLPLRPWRSIRVVSRRPVAEAGDGMARFTAIDPRVELCAMTEGVRGADVVLLCTSSATPVLDPRGLTRRALICSISTNAPRAHEIPPEALQDLDVYCDSRTAAPFVAGEMVIAQETLGWSPGAILGDLAELTAGAVTSGAGLRHVFFRSVGLGLEDIAIASALHRALANGSAEARS
jgi:L-arginine dehydrogenase